jgi:ankyrin repeat protein
LEFLTCLNRFIWAKLQLDLISRLTSDKAIRDALYKLPRGLENTYIRLLEQVKDRNAENLEIVLKTLIWIVSSLNPLTLGQLTEAISIEPGDMQRDTEKMITDDRDLLEMLGSLVTVDSTQEDPVVRLAHFTLDEFLQSDTLQAHESLWMFYVPVRHTMDVGITCIQYLSFSDFKAPCRSRQQLHERKSSYKLFEFAAMNWFSQILSYGARGPAIKNLLQVMNWFIEPCRGDNENFISWQQAFHDEVSCWFVPVDPLYYAIGFHMSNLFDILLQRGANPGFLYERGFTVLHVAAITGSEENVAAILQTEPDLEAPANGGGTALHLAAENGHFGVVKLLLEAGASPHAKSESESTPFYRAARSGSIPIMELLYQAGSDVNAVTWDEWTPIFEAIEFMHVPAVEWLVRRGATLNHNILDGPSVLEFAKNTGHKEIINLIEIGLSRR